MNEQLKTIERPFSFESSPLREAYIILGAQTPIDMNRNYTELDQDLMKNGLWDYGNPELITNKVKDILEYSDLKNLTEEEKEWRQEILWFWYHHAISCAIWRYRDRPKAIELANQALKYKPQENPNQITQILSFLVNDQLPEAQQWANQIEDKIEKDTANELIAEYGEGKFF